MFERMPPIWKQILQARTAQRDEDRRLMVEMLHREFPWLIGANLIAERVLPPLEGK